MSINNLINQLNRNIYHTVNMRNLFPLLLNYKSNDWLDYIKPCNSGYTRTKIYSNNFYDLFLINWSKNSKSKIHDHSKEGCAFKVLQGKLNEKIYNPSTLKLTQNNIFTENEISYINDNIGYHSIENDYNFNSYSLHLYIPSNHITKYYN